MPEHATRSSRRRSRTLRLLAENLRPDCFRAECYRAHGRAARHYNLSDNESRIRYSLTGQDTRPSPERPGFGSRWRNVISVQAKLIFGNRIAASPEQAPGRGNNRLRGRGSSPTVGVFAGTRPTRRRNGARLRGFSADSPGPVTAGKRTRNWHAAGNGTAAVRAFDLRQ
jgi:hypothetical protein